tara:strand:+ start:152 stop:370 length:219 start_codon:yes stop_codon:yes gene_type:complete
MTEITITEASRELGYKSRSVLHRFISNGCLDDYLIEINGRDHLVLKPAGKPKLNEYLASIVQWRIGNVITRY